MKRVLCVLLMLFVAISSMPIAGAASNNSDDEFCIYFDTTGWNGFDDVYCHVWETGKDSFFAWQSRRELCYKVSDNLYSYDIRNLWLSDNIKNGMQVNKNYCVVFSNNNNLQTYDLTFDIDCIGDTAYLTNNTITYLRSADEAAWKNNYKNYGAHLALNASGELIGSKLCPHESKAAFIGDWLSYYYNDFEVDAAADVVSNAMKKLNYYDADEIYKHIYTTKGSVNPLIDLILYKAEYNTCGVVSLDKEKANLYIGDTYKLPITKGGNYKKLTYKSQNTKIATVTDAGKITAKKAGTAKIEIKTPYITRSFTVTVKKPNINLKKKSLLMTVNEKAKLSYNAMPKKGFKISWKSSEPKIVKVTSKGVVKAVKQGVTYITVTMKYKGKNYTSKCKVISLKL